MKRILILAGILIILIGCDNAELEKTKAELELTRSVVRKTQADLQDAQAELQTARAETQKTQTELFGTKTELQKTLDRYKDIELIAKEIKTYRIKNNIRPTDSMMPKIRSGNMGGWVIDENTQAPINKIKAAFGCLESIDKLNIYSADDYFKK